jgi:hypothetical protein
MKSEQWTLLAKQAEQVEHVSDASVARENSVEAWPWRGHPDGCHLRDEYCKVSPVILMDATFGTNNCKVSPHIPEWYIAYAL